MLRCVREFFHERGVMEVDCAALSPDPSIDAHIDLIAAEVMGERWYLHSSPEYGMKNLLKAGLSDIYQLSHVFRDGESGRRHRPEFAMIEWYRLGFSLQQMWEETAALAALFVGERPLEVMSYSEAFQRHAGIDPGALSEEQQNYLLATKIEPQLSGEPFYIVTHFPPSQAALAKVSERGSERFELFFQGMELANGYDELTDPVEHKRRLLEQNQLRGALGKEVYPETVMPLGPFPDCCGVAVGFDRLLMLKLGVSDIADVLS
ncbi:MAG: EF-P lysine aminoacylase GenX [Parachlamydiales bacterium]